MYEDVREHIARALNIDRRMVGTIEGDNLLLVRVVGAPEGRYDKVKSTVERIMKVLSETRAPVPYILVTDRGIS